MYIANFSALEHEYASKNSSVGVIFEPNKDYKAFLAIENFK